MTLQFEMITLLLGHPVLKKKILKSISFQPHVGKCLYNGEYPRMYYASYIFRFILQGACREILCSPGKIYVDGDCSSSFLSQTSEILYGLAAKISFKNVASPDRIYLSDLIFELENIILNPPCSFLLSI